MEKTSVDPGSHIESLPEDVRKDVSNLDQALSDVMKGQSRVLWQGALWGGTEQHIIGYGDYTYKKSGNEEVEWFIVGLAVQKNHISVYVNAVEDGHYLAEKYADQLGKVKVGKSSIGFKSLADVDLDGLMELVAKAKQLMAK